MQRFRTAIVQLIAVLVTASAAHGQQQLPGGQIPVGHGQWAGPYILDMTQGWAGASWPDTQEIVHAAMLPPPDQGDAPPRVVFQPQHVPDLEMACLPCQPNGGGVGGMGWGRAFVWTPRAPASAVLIDPTPFPQDGTEMLFCGGHTFTKEGDLLWVGGTDGDMFCKDVIGCEIEGPDHVHPDFWGHLFARVLDTRAVIPTWQLASEMPRERWYPTATRLPDGAITVTGHIRKPIVHPSGNGNHDRYRDTRDVGGGSWSVDLNLAFEPPGCAGDEQVGLLDYPRMHVTATGWLLHANPNDGTLEMPVLGDARYFDLVPPFACSDPRWERGGGPSTIRLNGSSVHLIKQDVFDETEEVIYVVGGSTIEHEGLPCQCNVSPSTILRSVEKVVDPEPGRLWQPVAAMNHSRVNHNTVILADGSLLAVGGESTDGAGNCVSRKIAERYRPPELFPNTNDAWDEMAEQVVDRRYHSVAGLLPDGRVFSAGGVNLNHELNPVPARSSGCDVDADPTTPWDLPAHSVEVFSPPYCFRPRPVIDESTLDTNIGIGGGAFDFEVDVPSGREIERVAIIGSASVTHAFDSNQRYVDLPLITSINLGGGRIELTVNAPASSVLAPEGWYMLVVIDDNHSTPSVARWVRFGS